MECSFNGFALMCACTEGEKKKQRHNKKNEIKAVNGALMGSLLLRQEKGFHISFLCFNSHKTICLFFAILINSAASYDQLHK